MADTDTDIDVVRLATELTIAWLGNPHNRIEAADVPAFLGKMHATVQSLTTGPSSDEEVSAAPTEYSPAVSVRKSLASPDFIISLIDGKPYKSLRRHLGARGLTPDDYRERYGLKASYPMVAPAYGEQRREMAKRIGLGRKPGSKVEQAAKPAAKKRGTKAAGGAPADVTG